MRTNCGGKELVSKQLTVQDEDHCVGRARARNHQGWAVRHEPGVPQGAGEMEHKLQSSPCTAVQ